MVQNVMVFSEEVKFQIGAIRAGYEGGRRKHQEHSASYTVHRGKVNAVLVVVVAVVVLMPPHRHVF